MRTTRPVSAACVLLLDPCLAVSLAVCFCACAGPGERGSDQFHTSGSREADQRAEQRISRTEQMRGTGEGGRAADAKTKRSLYERLGGEEGIAKIVSDFVDRAIADPRVNWSRKGIKRGTVLGIGGHEIAWQPTPDDLTRLKRHLAQFLAVATGGPSAYAGRGIKEVHAGMRITNAEFDSAIGDAKATLDALGLPTEEQKELLAILESTRPQVAEVR